MKKTPNQTSLLALSIASALLLYHSPSYSSEEPLIYYNINAGSLNQQGFVQDTSKNAYIQNGIFHGIGGRSQGKKTLTTLQKQLLKNTNHQISFNAKIISGASNLAYLVVSGHRYLVKLSIDSNSRLIADFEKGASHVLSDDPNALEMHHFRLQFSADSQEVSFYYDDKLIDSWPGSTTSQNDALYFGNGSTSVDGEIEINELRVDLIKDNQFINLLDFDRDGIPDGIDEDDDGDGVLDSDDAFPLNPSESLDTDQDGIGNNSDIDDDDDGTPDDADAFPLDPTESTDSDGDGVGDNADTDDDGDGVIDDEDAFPLDPSESLDTDGDGIGNNADDDDDNDGTADTEDAFPLDPNESLDTDGDGIGNNADSDDDGDGIADNDDTFPLDPAEWLDTDKDGIGNNSDNDDDGDGYNDSEDAFPLDPTESLDTDGDGIGNNADTDDDGDGIPDEEDLEPLVPAPEDISARIDTGNADLVTESELYEVLRADIELSKQSAKNVRRKIFGLDGKLPLITNLSWKIPSDGVSLQNLEPTENTAILTSNYAVRSSGTMNVDLAVVNNEGRYAAFGHNPFDLEINDDGMEQLLKNVIAHLTHTVDITNTELNIVTSNLPQRQYYPFDNELYAWFEAHLPKAKLTPKNYCDGLNLSNCLNTNNDLLIVGQDETGELSESVVASTVQQALDNGIPVIYLHHSANTFYIGDKLLKSLKLLGISNRSRQEAVIDLDTHLYFDNAPTDIDKISNLIKTVEEQSLSYSDYSSCIKRTTTYFKCDTPEFISKIMGGAESARLVFNNMDSQTLDIFKLKSLRFYKSLALLGDKIRHGGNDTSAVNFPVHSTDSVNVSRSLLSDATIYNHRAIAPRFEDLGDTICTRDQVQNGSCIEYDIGSVVKHSDTIHLTLDSIDQWTATGFYALPGETINISRADENLNARVGVRINAQRNKTTRAIWKEDSYYRPERVASPVMWLKDQELHDITSAIGGPIYVHYESDATLAGSEVILSISGAAKHPTLIDTHDTLAIENFVDEIHSSSLPFFDLIFENAQVHSRKYEFLEGAELYNGDVHQLIDDYTNGFLNTAYDLAGVKTTKKELKTTLSPDVQSFCDNSGWNCYDETLHSKLTTQHINYDEYAQCGSACSGNPFDKGGSVEPLSWVEGHELGHNLQTKRLGIRYVPLDQKEHWSSYEIRYTENSNNIYPWYINWFDQRITKGIVGESYVKARTNPKGTFAMIQSENANLTKEIDGVTRKVIFNESCKLVADYSLDVEQPAYQYIYEEPGYAPKNNERLTPYIQIALLSNKMQLSDGTQLDNGFDILTLLNIHSRLFDKATSNEDIWNDSRANLGFDLFPYSGHSTYDGNKVGSMIGNDFMVISLTKITGSDWRPFFNLRKIPFTNLASEQVEQLLKGSSRTIGNSWYALKQAGAVPTANLSESVDGYQTIFEIVDADTRWPLDNFHPKDCLE
ncbi:ImpA family metalloprotease [Vibrio profundi]|uniref:ImpA family metalloprotease n=1 Tax=Vibrio profundi TaxID=1774960 RepID=UPI00373555BA